MEFPRVLVVGGSGFIGRTIVSFLVARGHRVVVPTRRRAHAQHLLLFPTCEVVEADVHDYAALAPLVARCDAVINLVGVLHSHRGDPYGPEFARAHVDLPRNLVHAMEDAGMGGARPGRLLHMSALGAAPQGPSMYLRSKADGEAAARSLPGIATTVFRPSVVFGPDDHFLNMFARLAQWLPVLPIGGADVRMQPVFVEDVATAFVEALENPATFGRHYELCGPRVYTLREIVRIAAAASGHPRWVVGLPDALARLQAWVLERMPGEPLLSVDNLDSLRVDNVAPEGWTLAPELGIAAPTPLEQQAAYYVRNAHPRTRYDAFRARARR
jgi:uncharacterized protein YbjT (DUF2867 family)